MERLHLTEKDRDLIIKQCQNQGATSLEQVAGFALAYADAKEMASHEELTPALAGSERYEALMEKILEWAKLVEPRNGKGYRLTPASFRNGRTALHPEIVPRAMWGFCMKYADYPGTPEEMFKEFEEIHPFEDGNGRVGHLLWAVMVKYRTGTWPETFPPEINWEK